MTEGVVWGGRFSAGPDQSMMEFTTSINIDMRLLEQDATVTKAHARTLVAAGLLDAEDLGKIDATLDALVAGVAAGDVAPSPNDEDVHSLVERWLTEQLGEVGRRIHAGRSRNDLVATDLRLWCKARSQALANQVSSLLETIAELGERYAEMPMPGYTHLQRAQPVTLGFHLLAHGFALARDKTRFVAARDSADRSPLGAGALAGSTLGLDPEVAAGELGFSGTFDNATDAVADRDFVWDVVYAAASCTVHLSRLSEEIVLWTSAEFGFARLSDSWSTGSSMMPQKRNPDVAELVRGRAAGAIADLTGSLTLLKGLPLAYNRDLQEDKEYVFRATDRIGACVSAIEGLLLALTFDGPAMEQAATDGPLWATDVAEHLVRQGVPFRKAHEATGKLVSGLDADAGANLTVEGVDVSDYVARDVSESIAARNSSGGPSSDSIVAQAKRLRTLATD
jgi:argininosuccinate lyase